MNHIKAYKNWDQFFDAFEKYKKLELDEQDYVQQWLGKHGYKISFTESEKLTMVV